MKTLKKLLIYSIAYVAYFIASVIFWSVYLVGLATVKLSEVRIFKIAIFAALVILASCSQNKDQLSYPNTVYIELNICEAPFYAIPNDTISDVKAFKLALDVLNNMSYSVKDNIFHADFKTAIIVPVGRYIVDQDMNWSESTVKIRQPDYSIFELSGSNISISGGTFIMD